MWHLGTPDCGAPMTRCQQAHFSSRRRWEGVSSGFFITSVVEEQLAAKLNVTAQEYASSVRLPVDRDGTVQPGDGLIQPTAQPGVWGRGFLFVGENETRAASPRWCWLSLGAGASLLPAGSPPSPTALSRGPALRTAWALSGVAVASVPAPPQSSLQAWEESHRGRSEQAREPFSWPCHR